MQETTRGYIDAGLQSRSLSRLRFVEAGLRDEKEEKCKCTFPSSRASSAKYATNAQHSTQKAFLSCRSSFRWQRLLLQGTMQSRELHTIVQRGQFRSLRWCLRTSLARARATRGSPCENTPTEVLGAAQTLPWCLAFLAIRSVRSITRSRSSTSASIASVSASALNASFMVFLPLSRQAQGSRCQDHQEG
jgi:hypothetical protein